MGAEGRYYSFAHLNQDALIVPGKLLINNEERENLEKKRTAKALLDAQILRVRFRARRVLSNE